jgi:hypothetical protein
VAFCDVRSRLPFVVDLPLLVERARLGEFAADGQLSFFRPVRRSFRPAVLSRCSALVTYLRGGVCTKLL